MDNQIICKSYQVLRKASYGHNMETMDTIFSYIFIVSENLIGMVVVWLLWSIIRQVHPLRSEVPRSMATSRRMASTKQRWGVSEASSTRPTFDGERYKASALRSCSPTVKRAVLTSGDVAGVMV